MTDALRHELIERRTHAGSVDPAGRLLVQRSSGKKRGRRSHVTLCARSKI